jgi:hypothetical protein
MTFSTGARACTIDALPGAAISASARFGIKAPAVRIVVAKTALKASFCIFTSSGFLLRLFALFKVQRYVCTGAARRRSQSCEQRVLSNFSQMNSQLLKQSTG